VQSIGIQATKKFLIPLPPFKEQQEIVKKIESHQPSLIDVEQSICINLTNAYLLRQSILKSAFEGKLVPQDPNDEPASVLLEKNYEEHLGKKKESTPLKRANRKGMIVLNEILSIYEVLSKAGTQLTPEELFKKANFSEETVDEFYQELREEVERSRIIEIRPNDADVYLQAVKNEDK
jgi:type I restriction enzyme S subunit